MADEKHPGIAIVQGASGPKAVIAGYRIRVVDIVQFHYDMDMTREEIARHLPTITLDDVNAALTYDDDHRAEIDDYIEDSQRFVEEYKRIHGPGRLAEKLRALQREWHLPMVGVTESELCAVAARG